MLNLRAGHEEPTRASVYTRQLQRIERERVKIEGHLSLGREARRATVTSFQNLFDFAINERKLRLADSADVPEQPKDKPRTHSKQPTSVSMQRSGSQKSKPCMIRFILNSFLSFPFFIFIFKISIGKFL